MLVLGLGILAFSTLYTIGGIYSIIRLRSRVLPEAPLGPVSVLKPLRGLDPSLESNLRTFFVQDHPQYELIFGVEGGDDPAIAVVKRLARQHPNVACSLVVHNSSQGLNPKVRNLLAMLPKAKHDIIVVSDSNIMVHPAYLREMNLAIEEDGIGLATSLFFLDDEDSLGARMESLHLAGFMAAGCAIGNELLDQTGLVGKSLMFRRSVFDALGGFESVKDVLAEDWVIGMMYQKAGYRIRISPTPLLNVNPDQSLYQCVERHSRWEMLRLRAAPHTWLLEILTVPLVMAGLAVAVGLPWVVAAVWTAVITPIRDALHWRLLRGSFRGFWKAFPLIPFREVLHLSVWLVAPFRRHIVWRGNRLLVAVGSRLYREFDAEAEFEAKRAAATVEHAQPRPTGTHASAQPLRAVAERRQTGPHLAPSASVGPAKVPLKSRGV